MTRSSMTSRSRACRCASRSIVPGSWALTAPPMPARSTMPISAACPISSSWRPPMRPNWCIWLRPRSRSTTVRARFAIRAAKAAAELAAHGLSTTIADARFMKPLDVDMVLQLARDHEILLTIEEGAIGGFGSHVMQTLAENGMLDGGLRMRSMVLPDEFLDHDTPNAMYARAGLDAKGIVAKVFEVLGKDFKTETVKLA